MKQSRLENRVKRTNLTWQKGFLDGCVLCFNKIASDGSGYANIKVKENNRVWGILYELADAEMCILDTKEGVPEHYLRNKDTQRLIKVNDSFLNAEVYIANPDMINNSLRPRSDYLKFLVEGAVEHGLPDEYIAFLKSFKTFG